VKLDDSFRDLGEDMQEDFRDREEESEAARLSRRGFLKVAGGAGLAVGLSGSLGALIAACGGGTASSSASATATATAISPDQANSIGQLGPSLLSTLPADIQADYELASTTPLGESIYKNFKPKNGPPWLIGFASSYAGNSWRIGARTRMTNVLLPKYKTAGLVKDVITTESNLVEATQIQQIRQLVNQGCDAIFTIGPSARGLNGAIKYAYDHGVLFVAVQGAALTPYALLVSGNYALAGKLQSETLSKDIGGQGNVLIVQGITQAQASQDFQRGHEAGLKESPGIKVVGVVAGMWTDAVAKTEVLKFISTHPAPLAGIASQSPGDLGSMDALMQLGQKVVPITAGGEVGPLVYWRDNPSWISKSYQSWPPGNEMQEGWEAMIRTLQGQSPKIATIMRGPSPIVHGDLATLLPAGATLTSNDWIQPPPEKWFPSAAMDNFFNNPIDPLSWKA